MRQVPTVKQDYFYFEGTGRSYMPNAYRDIPLYTPMYMAWRLASKPHPNGPCVYFGDEW